jgi:small subunit ribosomal protein S20
MISPLMANTLSAAKQARASLRSRIHNQRRISRVKTLEKEIRALVAKGDKDAAKKLLSEFQSAVDKARKGKTIHRNKASRSKSRIASLLNK